MLAVLLVGLTLGAALAWGRIKGSDAVVKASATAAKPVDGKQVVTITLDIDPKYHLYANPVGNEMLEPAQTQVSITGKEKPEAVTVDYPAGTLKKDKDGDYRIYKGKVTIKATVQRAKSDTGPLNVAIKLQACSEKSCLAPGTIKVTVP
jgi:hypothetical protein